jgi:branched-chain amino acid transport system substrate-binding protein
MEKRRGVGCFMLLVLASLVFLFVAVDGASTRVEGAETLKIGVISVLSGPGLPWGKGLLEPVEMAAEDINAQGGLKVGDKVYKIKLIPYDDKYTGEGGLAAATRLVYEDKVKYIIGPISSASLLAFQPITEREKVIVFGDTYTTKALSPDKPFTFRFMPTSNEFSAPQIGWISKKYPNLKTVVICAPNDETGREVAAQNVDGYKKAGIKVISVEYYQRGMLDMAPLITRVRGKKPDALESDGSAPGDVANLYKTARAMGYKGMIIRTGGEATEAIIAAAGQAVEGMIYHADTDMEGATSKLAAFFKKLRARRAGPILGFTPYCYNALVMLTTAMKNAGTVEDTNAVRVALEEIKGFDALYGKVRWTGKETYGINHQLTGSTYIGQVIGGKGKIIAKVD